MCRDELLLKTAILGLVSLDATQQQMATLLQCYKGELTHFAPRCLSLSPQRMVCLNLAFSCWECVHPNGDQGE